MSDAGKERELQKISSDGIPVKGTSMSRMKGLWFSRFAILFLWLYSLYPLRGLRLLADACLRKAFYFTDGKVPLCDERQRRQSVQEDSEYHDRSSPIITKDSPEYVEEG